MSFEMSEQTGELFAALAEAQKAMETAKKEAANLFFKSKYADLGEIIRVSKVANQFGLAVSQFPTGESELVTILGHKSGQWLKSSYSMKPVKNDPQGIGSCISYMKRYALQAVLGIPTDDDDGNQASQPASEFSQKEKTDLIARLKAQGETQESLTGKLGHWPPKSTSDWEKLRANL